MPGVLDRYLEIGFPTVGAPCTTRHVPYHVNLPHLH